MPCQVVMYPACLMFNNILLIPSFLHPPLSLSSPFPSHPTCFSHSLIALLALIVKFDSMQPAATTTTSTTTTTTTPTPTPTPTPLLPIPIPILITTHNNTHDPINAQTTMTKQKR